MSAHFNVNFEIGHISNGDRNVSAQDKRFCVNFTDAEVSERIVWLKISNTHFPVPEDLMNSYCSVNAPDYWLSLSVMKVRCRVRNPYPLNSSFQLLSDCSAFAIRNNILWCCTGWLKTKCPIGENAIRKNQYKFFLSKFQRLNGNDFPS